MKHPWPSVANPKERSKNSCEKIKFLVLRIDITISVDTRLKPYAVLITGKGIREWWQGEGDSLPLAICRAALLALGVTEI